MMIKVLNLYAGIGGNRKLWTDVDVTAVEIKPYVALIYHEFFPEDKLIIGDAHDFLLQHYSEFDFIWSSPPCVTHTRINKNFNRIGYIDMSLWQEIIFLQSWFKGRYCVENVIPYYKPLIEPQQINRHFYWCNFLIKEKIVRNPEKEIKLNSGPHKCSIHAKKLSNCSNKYFDLSNIDCIDKLKLISNCVNSYDALSILNSAFKEIQTKIKN